LEIEYLALSGSDFVFDLIELLAYARVEIRSAQRLAV